MINHMNVEVFINKNIKEEISIEHQPKKLI